MSASGGGGARIVIVGGGPAGLGAAWRLRELGHEDFVLYERNEYVGGLSASFRDEAGFTWDAGGHVGFSHYQYWDALAGGLLGPDFVENVRESWVRVLGRFVPYPFQNNIHRLPPAERDECLEALKRAAAARAPFSNFAEWIRATFGEGIARHFLVPQNLKTWVHPLEDMSAGWIAERVSVVDPARIEESTRLDRDDVGWGPNRTFRYPLRGGTGETFERLADRVRDRIRLGCGVAGVDTARRRVRLADGTEDRYDFLVTTAPLDLFVRWLRPEREDLVRAAAALCHTNGLVVGVGVARPARTTKCWIYFPGSETPFYRVTYLSNYSPFNSPGPAFHSLLCETSFSSFAPQEPATIVERTIDGLVREGLLDEEDRGRIVSRWLRVVPYTYPIPTLGRDRALEAIQPELERSGILSHGRFGAWRYETGNMDHSVMQGVEAAEKLAGGALGAGTTSGHVAGGAPGPLPEST